MKSHLTIPIAVLVAALLCYLLLWERGTEANRFEGESTRAVSPGRNHHSDSSAQHPTKLPRPDKPTPSAAPASHTPEQLKDFIIPSLHFEDRTLQEALFTLIKEYNAICATTGESPVLFNISYGGTPRSPINLHLDQISFLNALKLIVTQSGMTLHRDGSSLILTTLPDSPPDSLLTSAIAVPPDFLVRIRDLLEPPPDLDPFNPSAEPIPPRTLPATLDLFRSLGLLQGTETSASYLPGSSTLVTRGSAHDIANLNALLESLSAPPVMIKSQMKIIDSDQELNVPTEALNPDEFQITMRQLAQQKGVDIMTAPSITSRPGQNATIEIGREALRPDPRDPGEFESSWIGLQIDLGPGRYGFGLQSTGVLRESTIEGDDATGIISRSRSPFEGFVADGQTLIINTQAPDGTPRTAFVSTQLIDATGRPINQTLAPATPLDGHSFEDLLEEAPQK